MEAGSGAGSPEAGYVALAAEGEGPQELQAAGLAKSAVARADWGQEDGTAPAYIYPSSRAHRTLCILRTP